MTQQNVFNSLDQRAIEHFDRTGGVLDEARTLNRGLVQELADGVEERRPALAEKLRWTADERPES